MSSVEVVMEKMRLDRKCKEACRYGCCAMAGGCR